MDKDLKMRFTSAAGLSGRRIRESNERCNDIFLSFSSDILFRIMKNSHISAVINDAMDQREQQSRQTITFEVMESLRK
jgi:hypothetical protein